MKKVLFCALSICFAGSAYAGGLGLSEKVCRSESAKYQALDCTIATACEKRAAQELIASDEGFKAACDILYKKAGLENPNL